MTYTEIDSKVFPWAIVRAQPGAKPMIIHRYRSRTQAEANLKALRAMVLYQHYYSVIWMGDEE